MVQQNTNRDQSAGVACYRTVFCTCACVVLDRRVTRRGAQREWLSVSITNTEFDSMVVVVSSDRGGIVCARWSGSEELFR